MTNEFRWHARLQQNYNIGAAASRGKPGRRFSTLVRGQGGGRAGDCHGFCGCCHPLKVWPATVFVSHFIAAFQAMLKQKFGGFCIPALPVIYTPPCYSVCNVESFRKDNSLPGEEKPNCSISFLPQKQVISQASSNP